MVFPSTLHGSNSVIPFLPGTRGTSRFSTHNSYNRNHVLERERKGTPTRKVINESCAVRDVSNGLRPSSAMPRRQEYSRNTEYDNDATDILGVFIKKFSLYEPVLAKYFNAIDPTRVGIYEEQFMVVLDRIRVHFSDTDKYKLAECLFPTPDSTVDTEQLLSLMRRTNGPFSRPQSAKDMRNAAGIKLRRQDAPNTSQYGGFNPPAPSHTEACSVAASTLPDNRSVYRGASDNSLAGDMDLFDSQPQTSPSPSEASVSPMDCETKKSQPSPVAMAPTAPMAVQSTMSDIFNHDSQPTREKTSWGTPPPRLDTSTGSEFSSNPRPAHLRRGAGVSVKSRSAKRIHGLVGRGEVGQEARRNPILMMEPVQPTPPNLPASNLFRGRVGPSPPPTTASPSRVVSSADWRGEGREIDLEERSVRRCDDETLTAATEITGINRGDEGMRGAEGVVGLRPKHHRFRVMSRRPVAPQSAGGGLPPKPSRVVPAAAAAAASAEAADPGRLGEGADDLRDVTPVGLSSGRFGARIGASDASFRRVGSRASSRGSHVGSLVGGAAPFGADTGYGGNQRGGWGGGGRPPSAASSPGRRYSNNRRTSSRTSSAVQMTTGYLNRREYEGLVGGLVPHRGGGAGVFAVLERN